MERTRRGPERALIYLDTSVVLAQLLAEDCVPLAQLWSESLVSSRLLEYELSVRFNARRLAQSHAVALRQLLARVALLEMVPVVLARAKEPFPIPVRTLDALHLASIEFLREQGQAICLASFDARLKRAATAIGVTLYPMAGT